MKEIIRGKNEAARGGANTADGGEDPVVGTADHSGNYDITHVFIDNFLKMFNDRSDETLTNFFIWLRSFAERENIDFVISFSADLDTAPLLVRELAI